MDASLCEFNWQDFLEICAYLEPDMMAAAAVCYLNNFLAYVESHPPIFALKRVIHGHLEYEFYNRPSLLEYFRPFTVTTDQKDKKGTVIYKIWEKSPHRRTFKKIDFLPGLPLGQVETFNLFRGLKFTQEQVRGVDCNPAMFFMNHIRNVWCRGDPEIFKYTIKLLAYNFIYPDRRPGVAIVLQGGKGAGKSAAVMKYGELFDPHFKVADKRRAFGNFNGSVFKDALLVFLDEVDIYERENINKLKTFITSDIVSTEEKYQVALNVQNFTRWIIATNAEVAVPLTRDNRRFFVLEVADTFVGKAGDPKTREYFDRLVNIPAACLAALFYNSFDLSDFNPAAFPETPIMKSMKNEAFDSPTRFIIWSLQNSTIGYDEYFIETDEAYKQAAPEGRYNRFGFAQGMPKQLVFLGYKDWCVRQGIKPANISAENKFWEILKKICGDKMTEIKSYVGRVIKFAAADALLQYVAESLDRPDLLHGESRVSVLDDSWYLESFLADSGIKESPQHLLQTILPSVTPDFEPIDNLMYKVQNPQITDGGFQQDRLIPLPRRKAFYATREIAPDGTVMVPLYEYGNVDKTGQPYEPVPKDWPLCLDGIRAAIADYYGQAPNHCVLNYYSDGEKSIGPHSDKTETFIDGAPVLTLSLGGPRTMVLQSKAGNAHFDRELLSGSLFVLGWRTNEKYLHSIPKNPNGANPRMSLTFRFIAKTKALNEFNKRN